MVCILASWILYFAFIHIGICMLPVVFNVGMEATGSLQASMDMVIRVLKCIREDDKIIRGQVEGLLSYLLDVTYIHEEH